MKAEQVGWGSAISYCDFRAWCMSVAHLVMTMIDSAEWPPRLTNNMAWEDEFQQGQGGVRQVGQTRVLLALLVCLHMTLEAKHNHLQVCGLVCGCVGDWLTSDRATTALSKGGRLAWAAPNKQYYGKI